MIKLDAELRNELDVLAAARKKTAQELGIEAICDLLRKHGRPVSVRDAFRQSAGVARRRAAAKARPARGTRKAGGRKK